MTTSEITEPAITSLNDEIIAGLKTIYDPEIPVNIYDLGLIYDVAINDNNDVHIKMTLTAPACPFAQTFPGHVEMEVRKIIGVNNVTIELVWEPPWTKDNMSEEAKLQLGLF